MADNKPVALTRVYVSDDLSLLLWGKESITLSSLLYGAMEVKPAELPALIAALAKAAGEMGVSTVQGELVKAIKAVEWDADGVCPACESHKSVGHLSACTTAQALAKAE